MEMRRQRRIVYQTRIRLRAPGRDDSVIARVQNLSPRGVFVTASDIPEAGSEVQCRFTLAGQRRTLRGRVAWVRSPSVGTADKGSGAGIEFLDLEESDQHLLGRLVEPPPEARVPVDVSFEGLPAPVRCQAVVAGDGLRLVTGLPFMRLTSRVAVRFPGDAGEHHLGTIESVTLEPSDGEGIPQLELNVSIAPPSTPVPFALAPLAPIASTVVSASLSAPPPPRPAPGPLADPAEQTVRMQVQPGRLVGAVLAGRARRLRSVALRHWGALAAGFAAGALVVAAAAALLPDPPAAAPAPAGATLAEPAAPPPAVSLLEAPGRESQAPVAAPSEILAPAPATAPEPRTETSGPLSLTIEGRQLRLLVPVQGSTRSPEQYRLADPPGLAITLPRGRPRIAAGVYRPDGGPVRVQVRRRGPGSHLRFFFDPARYRGLLSVRDDDLLLELTERD